MGRRWLAFASLTLVVSLLFFVRNVPSASACSCVTQSSELSTFVGRVESASGDSFMFVDVVTETGPQVPGRVVVEPTATTAPTAPRVRPAVAAAIDAAPVADHVADDGYRPTVPIVLGAVLLAFGAGIAINRRRVRPR